MTEVEQAERDAVYAHDNARADQVGATTITCARSPGGTRESLAVCSCSPTFCMAHEAAETSVLLRERTR